jgi:hypothetical protein
MEGWGEGLSSSGGGGGEYRGGEGWGSILGNALPDGALQASSPRTTAACQEVIAHLIRQVKQITLYTHTH